MNIKHILAGARGSALTAAIVVAAACSSSAPGAPAGAPIEERTAQAISAVSEIQGVPLPWKYLAATLPAWDSGLVPLQYLRADGTPPPGHSPPSDPNDITPMDETEAYYANISPDGWVPQNLNDWKNMFQINRRESNQSVGDYRSQPYAQPLVVYYNKNELGLGRELGCGDWFTDGVDEHNATRYGVACFVTNYGAMIGDLHSSLFEAIKGKNAKNTVAIVYRPSLPSGDQVQFYVFDADGNRQDWAQLDTLGPRKHPQLCINCHGGSYDDQAHRVSGAHFLPLDPNTNVFNDARGLSVEDMSRGYYSPDPDPAHWWSRSAQEEDIRRINQIAMGTITQGTAVLAHQSTQQLSDNQRTALDGLYSGGLDTPNQASARPESAWVPPDWTYDQADRDLYTKVLKPYCITCHNAVGGYAFQKPWDFLASNALKHICTSGNYDMPQAQATMTRFWDRDPTNEMTINGVTFASPAEALLQTEFGRTGSTCTNIAIMSTCGGADSLCGDAHSGTACDTSTHRCVPDDSFAPALGEVYPTGVCRLTATGADARACPHWQECRPSTDTPPGYDGACFTCGRQGQAVCTRGPTCYFPAIELGDGTCHACDDDGGWCINEVYRKYNGPHDQPEWAGGASQGYHFYTLDDNEGWQWSYWNNWAGDFSLPRVRQVGNNLYSPPDTTPFYRCNIPGAGHLYTTSSDCEGVAGATNEGNLGAIGAYDHDRMACTIPGSVPLYRFTNTLDGDEFYTADLAERAQFIEYWDAAHHTWPWQWFGAVGCVWPG